MKKLRAKILLILVSVAVCFGTSFAPLIAFAEGAEQVPETNTEIVETTNDTQIPEETPVEEETSEIPSEGDGGEPQEEVKEDVIIDEEFDKYLQPVLCGFTGVSGTLAIVGIVLIYASKFIKVIKGLSDWWKKRKEELDNEGVDLKAIRDEFTSAIASNETVKAALEALAAQNKEEYHTVLNAVQETANSAVKLVAEMERTYEKKAELLSKQYEQLKQILILMVSGNAELVRGGISDEIIKRFKTEDLSKAR